MKGFFKLLTNFLFFAIGINLTNFTNNLCVYSSITECPNSPLIPDDRRIDKKTLRLVQYNVEWMFYNEYSGCPGNSCVWTNQTEVLVHMDYVAKIINDLKPDVVNFCEIESCDEIQMLINRTNNAFNPYLIKGTDSATGQNVGLMTLIDPETNLYRTETKFQYPISGSACGYNGSSGTTGVSKHFITKFKFTNDNKIINIGMISTHLLAYPTDPERCSKREAQAMILQEEIYNLINQGYSIVMIGDFNDWDNLIMDANNNLPISKVLDILKGNIGKYSSKYKLKSIGDKIPKEQRYSEYWDENADCVVQNTEFSMIDHILLTQDLHNLVSNAFVYHTPHSCDGNSYNSDHDPVVIDFEF